LLEGARYEYEFADVRLRLDAADGEPGRLIEASRLEGRAHSGFFVPQGSTPVGWRCWCVTTPGTVLGAAALEVRSRKLSYREDYRQMLEDITDRCIDLLIELRAPTAIRAAPDPWPRAAHARAALCLLEGTAGVAVFPECLASHCQPPAPTLGT
jgi:hypothetical protein